MGYKVRLNVFEGPFDLLVYLIENAQMNIYDIKISEITSQYLAYIDEMKKMEVSVASEFMVLAAALIELKSKMLLPRSAPDAENVVEEDPRTELVAKLLEYKKFKLLAGMLSEQEIETEKMIEKPQEDISMYTDQPEEYLTLEIGQFVNAFNLFLQRKQKLDEMHRTYERLERQRITAEQKMDFIKDFFVKKKKKSADFRELLKPESDKYEVALTFTSMLEMINQNRLSAQQKENFGNITLRWTEQMAQGKEADHDE